MISIPVFVLCYKGETLRLSRYRMACVSDSPTIYYDKRLAEKAKIDRWVRLDTNKYDEAPAITTKQLLLTEV